MKKGTMRFLKKFTALTLSFCLALCLFLPAASPVHAREEPMSDEPVSYGVGQVVEFEDGVRNPDQVTVENDGNAFGGRAVQVKPDAYITPGSWDKCLDPNELDKPDAGFTFEIPEDGVYNLWIRALPTLDSGNNNIWAWWDQELGGETPVSSEGAWLNNPDSQNYQWYLPYCKDTHNLALEAGVHTVYFTHRTRQLYLDALFLCKAGEEPPKTDGKNGASQVIQFEDGMLNLDQVTVEDDENAFGGRAVQVKPDAYITAGSWDKCLDPNELDKPDASFTFVVPEDGVYNLWIRALPTLDSGNNNIWAWWDQELGGETPVSSEGAWMGNPDSQNYQWYLPYCKDTHNLALEAGVHTLYFTHRTRQLYLDALFLARGAEEPPRNEGGVVVEDHQPLPSGVYKTPSITPPDEHPRLMFRAADIPEIRANMEGAQNAAAKTAFQTMVDTGTDGVLQNTKNNYDSYMMAIIEALAFDYAIFGNEDSGREAISAIKNVLPAFTIEGVADYTRAVGHVIFVASEVYDWCYDLLDEEDQKHIVFYCEYIARYASGGNGNFGMEIGWPPRFQGAVAGHGGEAQLLRDLLSFGIATYDEHPDIYEYTAGRILEQFVETRDFWYDSHSYHQGDAYGPYRFMNDMWSAYIFRAMSGEDIYSDDMAQVAYEWIYTRRSDGQLFRVGDDFIETYLGKNGYYPQNPTFLMAASLFDNPHFKYEGLVQNPGISNFNYINGEFTPVAVLIVNDPSLEPSAWTGLPQTTYLGSPRGTMVARTGWDMGAESPNVEAYMNIGEWWGSNHHHLDAGSFQLYYKGILASDSGVYDSYGTSHDFSYNKRTIAHNSITVYDPDEEFKFYGSVPAINDGGQRAPNNINEPGTLEEWMTKGYQTGEVLGHEFGPDENYPEYTYIKGDISLAYSDKVEEALRSMLFMPLEDPDHPAVMIVMDKVTSSNPDFKKAYLLHMQQEPTVEGNKTVVVRDTDGYNGRMVNETLLPAGAVITKIGGPGREFEVQGTNYPSRAYSANLALEDGWGRVEISPADANKTDYFLNVMTVSDADTTAGDLQSQLIEGNGYVGAVLADRAAIFAKDADRLENTVRFNLPENRAYKVFISGIREGTWTVDQTNEDVIATTEGGAMYFTVTGGSEITLTYKNPDEVRSPVPPVTPPAQQSGIRLLVNSWQVYTPVQPVLRDTDVLVPGAIVAEKLAATDVSYNESTGVLTGVTKEDAAFEVQRGSATAKLSGREITLPIPAEEIRGVLMVPFTFFSEALYARGGYNELGLTVTITGSTPPVTDQSAATIVDCDWDRANQFENETGDRAWDGDYDTTWSSGAIGAWFSLEFDKPYNLYAANIFLNKATERHAVFELAYSLDGENYTSLGEYTANGTTFGEEFLFDDLITAKYIRYINKGSDVSDWGAVKEISFLVQTTAKIVDCDWDRIHQFENETGFLAWDGDQNTNWSSGEIGAWFSVEFDKPYSISAAEIFLNKATERKASFELEYSLDGNSYTSLGDFTANGTTFGEIFSFSAPVTAGYLRFINKGSDAGTWGAVREISLLLHTGDSPVLRTLTFESNGGSAILPVSKEQGGTISLTDSAYTPTRSGYSFSGWYYDMKLTSPAVSVILTESMTVYAKWTKRTSPQPGEPVESVTPGVPEISAKGGMVEITVGGTGKSNAEVVIVDQDGKEIARGRTDVSGKVRLSVPKNETGEDQKYIIQVKPEGSSVYSAITGTITVKAGEKALPFTDVKQEDHWFYADVFYVWENGLMNGTAPSLFRPGATMTRGMLVTVLGRAAGIDIDSYVGESFTDIPETAYYRAYVKWASEKGIVNGVGGNRFAPESPITREQAALIFSRYAKAMNRTLPQKLKAKLFEDTAGLSDESKAAVAELNRAGVIGGKSDTRFDPKGAAKRSEVAAMLHRFMVALK